MKTEIQQKLLELEQQHNIEILYACETGSRAWGFPSPDSDYDIRLLYKHEPDWYVSLHEPKDTIELMLEDGNFDITGWDIRKALRLLWKSNASLLERIQSPIVYMEKEGFATEINQLGQQCYSPIAVLHHYLSLTKKCLQDLELDSRFRLKLLFYALRNATACRWVLEQPGPPPIVFQTMLNGLGTEEALQQRITELVALKATKDESYMHEAEPELMQYIRESIDASEELASSLFGGRGDMKKMNASLRKIVQYSVL